MLLQNGRRRSCNQAQITRVLSFVLRFTFLCIAGCKCALVCDPTVPILIPAAGIQGSSAAVMQMGNSYTYNRSVETGRNVQMTYDIGKTSYILSRLQGTAYGSGYSLFGVSDLVFPGGVNPEPQRYIQIPLAVEAKVIYVNLPQVIKVNLSFELIAKIYLGYIKYWNATEIQMINPDLQLPAADIKTIARKDTGSQTRIFTSLLSAHSAEWKQNYGEFIDPGFVGGKCCNATNWPPNIDYWASNTAVCIWAAGCPDAFQDFQMPNITTFLTKRAASTILLPSPMKALRRALWNGAVLQSGRKHYCGQAYMYNVHTGIAGMAASIPYLIGYGFLNDAKANNISFAALLAANKSFVEPNLRSMLAAARFVADQHPTDTYYQIADANTPDAYPMTYFVTMVLDMVSITNFSCCAIEELVGFIDYVYSIPVDSLYRTYVVNVDPRIRDLVRSKILQLLTCNGESMYAAYLQSLEESVMLQGYQIALIVVASVTAFLIGLTTVILCWRKALIEEGRWLIHPKAIDFNTALSMQSVSSLQHSNTSSSKSQLTVRSRDEQNNIVNRIQHPLIQTAYDDRIVFLRELSCRSPKSWTRESKTMAFRFVSRLSHTSLTHVFGFCGIGSKVFSVEECCPKGTLHYVLRNSRFEFNDTIKISLATDVAEALTYLHSRGIVHGLLNSMNCYVGNSWVVKVANWMEATICYRENSTFVRDLVSVAIDKDELKDEKFLIDMLYIHPGLRKSGKFTRICDVFSFGMLLVEIVNRNTPFAYEVEEKQTSFYKLIKNKLQLDIIPHPQLHTTHPCPILEQLARKCIIEELNSFDNILNELQEQHLTTGSITEILMENMEAMITDMENKSSELVKVTAKIKELLNQVLPPTIAEKFINGQTVEPEHFESCSVFFSDIVGFTTISSKSTPLEVMTLLNDLWLAFDATIDQFDCYKVDTIGDAYMVCSGLPKRNGILHVKYIADMSLALLERTDRFIIRHMYNEKLRIRIGVNSGAATAGVVGVKLPQYCVFGETVTTASLMESSGVPGKAQLTEASAKLLRNNFARYRLEKREEIDRFKGNRLVGATYFLEPDLKKITSTVPRHETAIVFEQLQDTTLPGVASNDAEPMKQNEAQDTIKN